ncbi:minichromosome maintenance 10 homolog [Megachile rotundata]|uniref:minichromosome maintenance 10 homolog n=1 Tax=Megachile rotundata TaxID=143995 RepID=UPI000258DEF7|nr:PREDICTED: protein MCM10 homolog [Megachile rotundata]
MDNASDSDVDDVLNDLLAINEEEKHESPPKETLKELDFNFLDSTPKPDNENKSDKQGTSQIYDETIDSSDDEDRRYFEEQKYSNYGRDIKSLLKKEGSKHDENRPRQESTKTFDFSAAKKNTNISTTTNNNKVVAKDVYSDPFFGLKIINPIVSSAELKTRMNDKIPVTVSRVKYHISTENLDKDWVIAGVLISKSPPKTSQKGTTYCIWKLSDLSENMSSVSLFLFSTAYKTFWKTTVGTVVGVLNPNILESKDNIDLATLSVDNPQKIMILGTSKDMGKCRSKKNNGEPCNSIVNISRCEFCLFHIKKEYKKCSLRSELQTFSNTQKFSIDMLKLKKEQQKKPLNCNMPEFNAVVAVKSKKLQEKDAKRLALLSGTYKSENSTENMKDANLKAESSAQQMQKNLEEINKSRGWKAAVLSQTSNNSASSSPIMSKLNSRGQVNLSMLSSSSRPRLGIGCQGGTIDLSEPITKKQINLAKNNAIKWVQKNGKIKPNDPNKIRLNKEEKLEIGKKRPRDSEDSEKQETKKPNVISDKFKEMMQAKSAHTDLIEKSDEQEQEKYFNKLEMKERMEEKMLNTYKVACKAVKCLTCKYTSFSASDMCKEQKHPLRVVDGVKRFFKCGDCGNRTVSLDRIPSHSCIKCSSSNWSRAAMMDERKTNVAVTALSIRGDEETYIGSMTKDANLNLLVPEKDDK